MLILLLLLCIFVLSLFEQLVFRLRKILQRSLRRLVLAQWMVVDSLVLEEVESSLSHRSLPLKAMHVLFEAVLHLVLFVLL